MIRRNEGRVPASTAHRLVREHAASFIAHTGGSTGVELPRLEFEHGDVVKTRGQSLADYTHAARRSRRYTRPQASTVSATDSG